jgi:hypothetical protein
MSQHETTDGAAVAALSREQRAALYLSDAQVLYQAEIARLRAALETARLRFEMIARGHPGASAEAGARDAAEALAI